MISNALQSFKYFPLAHQNRLYSVLHKCISKGNFSFCHVDHNFDMEQLCPLLIFDRYYKYHSYLFYFRVSFIRTTVNEWIIEPVIELLRPYTGSCFFVHFHVYCKGLSYEERTFQAFCFENHKLEDLNEIVKESHLENVLRCQLELYSVTKMTLNLSGSYQVADGPLNLK